MHNLNEHYEDQNIQIEQQLHYWCYKVSYQQPVQASKSSIQCILRQIVELRFVEDFESEQAEYRREGRF